MCCRSRRRAVTARLSCFVIVISAPASTVKKEASPEERVAVIKRIQKLATGLSLNGLKVSGSSKLPTFSQWRSATLVLVRCSRMLLSLT